MTTKKPRRPRRSSMATVLADPRWKMLATGRATPEEIADLRTLAEQNQFAAEAWEACHPPTQEESTQLADELWRKRLGSRSTADDDADALGHQPQARPLTPQTPNDKASWPGQRQGRRLPAMVGSSEYRRLRLAPEALERVVAGDHVAMREFLVVIEPVIQGRIRQILLRGGSMLQGQVDDISQDTVIALLEDAGRRIKSWDPTRGSFEAYAGIIAEQKATDFLRKRQELLMDGDASEVVADSDGTPERLVASKQITERVAKLLQAELSDTGRRIFKLMYIDGRSVDEICKLLQIERSGVYAWRSRFGRRIEELLDSMDGSGSK